MKVDASKVRELEGILEEELSAYRTYLSVIKRERSSVELLKSDEVTAFTEQRSQIVDRLAELRNRRTEMVASISGNDAMRLSDFIEQAVSPGERKRLLGLVTKIKEALALVDAKSREFNQVLNFSLGLVNGEISLLWSASQTVTRVYNAYGSLSEGSQPTPPRAGSLLGEA